MAYDPEKAKKICEHIADGKSMRQIETMQGMPSRMTIYRWRLDNPDFDSECARASHIHADDEFDRLREIENGVLDGDVDSQAARCVLSSMQWRLDKLNNNKYGNLSKQEISGPGGGAIPITHIDFCGPDESESC